MGFYSEVDGPRELVSMAPRLPAGVPASPMRLLEMLVDRFGVFEALAHSTLKLNRCTSADELSMDPHVADAVLEFADDLRTACAASDAWAESNGLMNHWCPVAPSRLPDE